ncbi:hypothetical protein OSTOST_14621 [Ostertagia ostertagi]
MGDQHLSSGMPGDLFELNKGGTTKYLSELWGKSTGTTDCYNKMRSGKIVRSVVLSSYFYNMSRMGIKFQTALTDFSNTATLVPTLLTIGNVTVVCRPLEIKCKSPACSETVKIFC